MAGRGKRMHWAMGHLNILAMLWVEELGVGALGAAGCLHSWALSAAGRAGAVRT